MEEVERFYLMVIAELKLFQTDRLSKEKKLSVEYPVYHKKRHTWKARRLAKKHEKQHQKIENGYYKGINDCLNKINKIYKNLIKCSSRE